MYVKIISEETMPFPWAAQLSWNINTDPQNTQMFNCVTFKLIYYRQQPSI